MKLITKVTNIFDRTNNLLAFLGAALLIYVMLSVTASVVMRYFLRITTIWMFEVNEYALLYITFLGTAWLLKREGHIKMDIVLAQLKPKPQAMVNIITSIVGVITFLVIAWYSADVSWYTFQEGYFIVTWLKPPKWPILAIIPVGSFLFSIQFLRRAYGYLRSWKAL